MATENTLSQQLLDLLATRDLHPEMLDRSGRPTNAPDAKTFTFDYQGASGKNYGTMVIVLDSDNEMKIMYGDNLGRTMEGTDKNEFFDFIQHLSKKATMNRWTHTIADISQLKHTMQGLAAITEGLFEGYYGTRRISYAGEPTEARLMIRHNRNLGENDARFRYVESIFVETAEGERYRLPFTNLAGGRAMLEHVRQGGKPYDVRGNHICEMITELKVLTRFNRASQGRVLEGIKQGVVEGAQTYYKTLRESIKRLSSPRGYAAYFESWHPANITEQDQLVEDIKTLFVEQTIDDRIEQALPLLAKIQRGREMKEADIFENWVNSVTESTWSLPETPEQLNRLKELMSGELIVGPDGTNAKEQLRDIIGDDDLFNRIADLAAQDPDANLWDDTDVQDILRALGIQMPDRDEPDMDAQPDQGVAEAGFPGAPDVEMPPMNPSGDPQRDKLKQEYMDLHREIKSLVDLQYRSTSEEQKMQAKARIKQLNDRTDEIKAILEPRQPPNEWQKKTYGFDDNWNKVNQGVAEDQLDEIGNTPAGKAALRAVQNRATDTMDTWSKNSASGYSGTPKQVNKATGAAVSAGNRLHGFGPNRMQQNTVMARDALRKGMAESAELNTMLKYAGVPVAESRMIDESGETLMHVLDRFKHEVAQFEQGADLDDNLFDALYDYYVNKGEMPYGTAKARSGDPYEWVSDRLDQELGTGNHAMRDLPEADAISTFEVMSGFDAPVVEGACNMTAEGSYCPEHGLAECGGGMYESREGDAVLARIKSLALLK